MEGTKQNFYSIKQASEKIDSSPRMLTEHIRSGELKGYKNLNKWYVLHDDLYSFIFDKAMSSENYNKRRGATPKND